jgi:predicted dithiol-disulfide oxidoreductase (DUF899 family)
MGGSFLGEPLRESVGPRRAVVDATKGEKTVTAHRTGTREEWAAAREELLAGEKEHRLGDELARQRRELPWVRVEKEYRFDTDDGTRTLAELFDGRGQLVVYPFMFGPSYQAGCPTCSSIADAVDGVVPHLNARDVTVLFVSQAPLEKLQAYKRRMGWSFPWVSSANSDFNLDLGSRAARSRRAPGSRRCSSSCRRSPAATRARAARRRRLPDREAGLQRLRRRRRGRLLHVFDRGSRGRVPDGLLRHPRPDADGPRRRRRVPGLDPPARRVRQRVRGAERDTHRPHHVRQLPAPGRPCCR